MDPVVIVGALFGAFVLFCMMLLANFLAFGTCLYLVSKVLQRRLSGLAQGKDLGSSDD
jgi:hypothetical protein